MKKETQGRNANCFEKVYKKGTNELRKGRKERKTKKP